MLQRRRKAGVIDGSAMAGVVVVAKGEVGVGAVLRSCTATKERTVKAAAETPSKLADGAALRYSDSERGNDSNNTTGTGN